MKAAVPPRRRCVVPYNAVRDDLHPPMMAELIQSRFEIVEDDAVGEALEDERKLPEWVDDADWDHRGHSQDIDDDADDADSHAEEQDGEARGHSDDLEEAEIVTELYIPEEVPDGENPPRIASSCSVNKTVTMLKNGLESSINLPENSLVWPCCDKKIAFAAIEKGEIGIDLQDPVGLDDADAANIDPAASASQERLALYPRDHVVERPRRDERDDG